jgi:hypothetical protein
MQVGTETGPPLRESRGYDVEHVARLLASLERNPFPDELAPGSVVVAKPPARPAVVVEYPARGCLEVVDDRRVSLGCTIAEAVAYCRAIDMRATVARKPLLATCASERMDPGPVLPS